MALVVLIAHGATNQLTTNAKAQLDLVTRGNRPKLPESMLMGMYEHVHSLNSVNNCFLYLVFWLVKISFLLFYYLLFKISKPFQRTWWVVFSITLLTFWVPIAGVLTTCAGANTVSLYSTLRVIMFRVVQRAKVIHIRGVQRTKCFEDNETDIQLRH